MFHARVFNISLWAQWKLMHTKPCLMFIWMFFVCNTFSYFWEPEKDRVYKTNLKERQWTEERAQRLRETIELKKRLLADKEGKGE